MDPRLRVHDCMWALIQPISMYYTELQLVMPIATPCIHTPAHTAHKDVMPGYRAYALLCHAPSTLFLIQQPTSSIQQPDSTMATGNRTPKPSMSAQGGLLPVHPSSYSSVLLINNAGQTGSLAFTWGQSLANIRRQMDLNVTSPAFLTSRVVGAFLK